MWYPEMKWQFPFFYLLSLSLSLSLSLPDYTNCVSILAVRFHTREGPIEIIELFKLHHLQPEIKCSGFVDGNSFLMIENTSIEKMKDFVTAFALLLCSHYVSTYHTQKL